MAANANFSDLATAGIENRSREIADNVLGNNPVSAQLKKKGRVRTFDGGTKIIQELSFTTNPNGGAYSGYDVLPIGPAEVISAAEYAIKQYAVPVTVSGLEEIQNSGRSKMIDLVDARLEVAESTMANLIETGIYGDGTTYSGKAITGLGAAVEATATASQTSTYGGISRTSYSFWRNYCVTGQDISTAAKIQTVLNTAWASLVRGADRPDLIVMGSTFWANYLASLQALQRFTEPGSADLGFPTIKYMTADVVLGGGIGGVVDTKTCLLLNSKYLFWRPYAKRDMVALDPKRFSLNQDASVTILAFAGNLCCSGAQFQGRVVAA